MSSQLRRRTVGALLMALAAGGPALAQPATVDSVSVMRAIRVSMDAERDLQQGRGEAAQQGFQRALSLVPQLPSAHAGLGHLAMKAGRHEEALAHYERARQGWYAMSDLMVGTLRKLEHDQYGQSMRRIAELSDALEQLDRFNRSPMASLMRSRLENQIQREQARQMPRDEPVQREAPGIVYFYIGNALFQLDRRRQAIDSWETCIELDPDFAEVYVNLSLAYLKENQIERARWSIERARELGYPVDPRLWALIQTSR